MHGQMTKTSEWKSSPRRRCESIHVYEDGYDVSDDVRLALARVRSTHTSQRGHHACEASLPGLSARNLNATLDTLLSPRRRVVISTPFTRHTVSMAAAPLTTATSV